MCKLRPVHSDGSISLWDMPRFGLFVSISYYNPELCVRILKCLRVDLIKSWAYVVSCISEVSARDQCKVAERRIIIFFPKMTDDQLGQKVHYRFGLFVTPYCIKDFGCLCKNRSIRDVTVFVSFSLPWLIVRIDVWESCNNHLVTPVLVGCQESWPTNQRLSPCKVVAAPCVQIRELKEIPCELFFLWLVLVSEFIIIWVPAERHDSDNPCDTGIHCISYWFPFDWAETTFPSHHAGGQVSQPIRWLGLGCNWISGPGRFDFGHVDGRIILCPWIKIIFHLCHVENRQVSQKHKLKNETIPRNTCYVTQALQCWAGNWSNGMVVPCITGW